MRWKQGECVRYIVPTSCGAHRCKGSDGAHVSQKRKRAMTMTVRWRPRSPDWTISALTTCASSVSRDIASARVDRSLVKAIACARDLRRRLEREGKSLDELAREDGCSRPYVSSMIRLAYLAPGITQSI